MKILGWILAVLYWLFIANLVLADAWDCIHGSVEYPCPTPAQFYRDTAVTLTVGLTLHAIVYALVRGFARWRRTARLKAPTAAQP